MIGKISIGKSFRGCLSYCLEDKVQKLSDEPVIKNRAEVLTFNLCFGNKKELIQQFNEVRQLNSKLSKPVLHVTLSLALGEKLSKATMIEMVNDCAKQMGFEQNQYIAIHHNDTKHQHLHIVANRVGLDGKTVKDNHNYRKIADYCRKMELKHDLKQVLSPKQFLPKELRQIPRLDTRKETLRRNIHDCISASNSYSDFEKMIRQRGYEVIKARGISFLDKQKVKVKGSEVSYSLQTIEKLLALKPELRVKILEKKEWQYQQQISSPFAPKIKDQKPAVQKEKPQLEIPKLYEGSSTLDILLTPQQQERQIDYHLQKKRKRKRRPRHL